MSIPKPTFQITGMVTGQAEFAATERKAKANMINSTFKQQDGNRRFYVLQTMGGEFPITLTDDLKDAMKDGHIYKLSGHLDSIRGGIALRVHFIEESDEMQYMLSVPSWEAIGVISSLNVNEEQQASNVTLSIPGVMLRFFGVPLSKVPTEAKGKLARVNGVLGTRPNQRTGTTSIDTQFGSIEFVDAKEVLKQGASPAATGTTVPKEKKSA